MEDGKVSENSLTSAAAFVEGGVQEACDDACSICLEAFCDSDPSTVTSCKHEFHLQCILEWCQRSSQCPMCWQPISLKDPSSQELLDAVEHERNIRMNPPRSAIFHHPALGDFELQHLPVNATESELEERIIQHLAAAAAMGRARQLARREGQRNNRPSAQARPQFLVFSNNPNGASSPNASNTSLITVAEDSSQLIAQHSSDQLMASGPSSAGYYQYGTSSSNRRSPAQTSPGSQDRAGPSDLQSFSDTLKSRLTALSSRYKESLTKSTRGWKEKLFARNINTSITPETSPRAEATGQTSVGTVSRMMDHLEIGEDAGTHTVSGNVEEDGITTNLTEEEDETMVETGSGRNLSEDNNSRVSCAAAASSASIL